MVTTEKWTVSEGVLTYWDSKGVPVVPAASEIYCLVFGGRWPKDRIIPSDAPAILSSIPSLTFSKISVTPKLHLYFDEGKISLKLSFYKNGVVFYPRPMFEGGTDHFVTVNRWFYFSPAYHAINKAFQEAGINRSSNISFASYLKLTEILRNDPSLSVDDQIKDNLRSNIEEKDDKVPTNLNANLYVYQSVGYRWLKYVTDEGCGCILGDEMGLGKTLQIIALLLQRKSVAKAPALVVAPVSLLENWRREIDKFAPSLSVLVHHGSKRTGYYKKLLPYDVVLTAYGTVMNDLSILEMISWDLLVLDEAQNIKNPQAQRTKTVKQLARRASIAVTGTPFENHVTDIWSLLDFIMPGYPGTKTQFEQSYSDDVYGANEIEPLLTPLMLRRRVTEVAQDLPERVIISQPLVLNDGEARNYEDERQRILNSCNPKAVTLAMLTKLRMFCTHPFLVQGNQISPDPALASTKYTRLCELLEEIIANGEKTILFTSYTGMIDILVNDIPARFNIPVLSINGSTPVPDRQPLVDSFGNYAGPALLVLNPKAAGVGLNITAANHVIHYNLEWNPALEDQATARAYRRGQDKPVFVYRLFVADSVEEFVNEKIEKKRDMSEAAVVGSNGHIEERNMVLAALSKSPFNLEGLRR